MRDIKFEYIFEDIIHGGYVKKVFTIEDIEYGEVEVFLDDTAALKIVTRRQSTGLLDKQGVEIYEGDILTTECTQIVYIRKPNIHGLHVKTKDIKTMGTVLCEWVGYGFRFNHTDKTKHLINIPTIEVIGNIYENPELLDKYEDN